MPAKVTIDEKRKVAIVEVPLLEQHQTSSSGSTISVALARNERTPVVYQGKPIRVSCQVYYKPTP